MTLGATCAEEAQEDPPDLAMLAVVATEPLPDRRTQSL